LHTQKLSLEFHESYTSGRIISRQTSDLDTIRELLDGGLNELVSGVLYGLFTLGALFLIDWQSGLILTVMGIPDVPADAVVLHAFAGHLPRVARDQRAGHRQVRRDDDRHPRREGLPQDPRNDAEFGKLAGDYRDVNMRSIRLFGTFEPGIMAVAAVSVAVVLLWGGGRVIAGPLEIGVLTAAVLYVRNFFSPLQEVAFFLNSYQSATAALEKVSGVLEEEPTVPDP
ncbi:ABC transporter, partial [Microbacterium sp. SUBG005]